MAPCVVSQAVGDNAGILSAEIVDYLVREQTFYFLS